MPRPYGRGTSSVVVFVVDLVVDLVDVNLDIDLADVDLVDVDLVDILFVVLLMSLRGLFSLKKTIEKSNIWTVGSS